MNHTKGEWKIFTDSEGYLSIYPIAVFIDHGNTDITDEDRANARLIVAAPDLLIACQQFVNDGRVHSSVIDQGITAINKATKE